MIGYPQVRAVTVVESSQNIDQDIERYEKLTLEYQDRHGNEMTIEAEGLLSVAIQHEANPVRLPALV